VVDLIRSLWQDGIDTTVVCDPDIDLELMLGSNRDISGTAAARKSGISFVRTIATTLKECQAVVVNQNRPEFVNSVAGPEWKYRGNRSGAFEQRALTGWDALTIRGISW